MKFTTAVISLVTLFWGVSVQGKQALQTDEKKLRDRKLGGLPSSILNEANIREEQTICFDSFLDEGYWNTILELGPITVYPYCNDGKDEIALEVEIRDYHNDLFVFGHLADDANMNNYPVHDFVLHAGDKYVADIWDVEVPKGRNKPDVGAAHVTDGCQVWYLGVDGDSMIGIGENNWIGSYNGDIIPDHTQCVISGCIHYYESENYCA